MAAGEQGDPRAIVLVDVQAEIFLNEAHTDFMMPCGLRRTRCRAAAPARPEPVPPERVVEPVELGEILKQGRRDGGHTLPVRQRISHNRRFGHDRRRGEGVSSASSAVSAAGAEQVSGHGSEQGRTMPERGHRLPGRRLRVPPRLRVQGRIPVPVRAGPFGASCGRASAWAAILRRGGFAVLAGRFAGVALGSACGSCNWSSVCMVMVFLLSV